MSKNSLEEVLGNLSQRIVALDTSTSERRKELEKILNNILENIEVFEESWSGYWLKLYANLYYDRLQKPPPSALIDRRHARLLGIPQGWMRLDSSEVDKIIEEHCEISLNEIQEEIDNQIIEIAEVRDHLCVELSLIKGRSQLVDEAEELENLEKLEWGISVSDFIHFRQPKRFVGNLTDIEIGFEVPPHIQLQATVTHLLTKNSSGLDLAQYAF